MILACLDLGNCKVAIFQVHTKSTDRTFDEFRKGVKSGMEIPSRYVHITIHNVEIQEIFSAEQSLKIALIQLLFSWIFLVMTAQCGNETILLLLFVCKISVKSTVSLVNHGVN